MSNNTPICHVAVPSPVEQPDGVQTPQIPIATDLASALAAINAMRIMLQRLSGQNPNRFGGRGGGGGGGGNGGNSKKDKNPKPGRWNELSRKTSKVKVYNPQDHEQWVEVERTNQLIMKDTVTNELWVYNLRGSGG